MDRIDFHPEITDRQADDLLYAECYLLKKLESEYGFNLNGIKNANEYGEYKKIIELEKTKLPNNLNHNFNHWYWDRLYPIIKEFVDMVQSLDYKEFDINLPSYAWFDGSIIKKYISSKKVKKVLSIYNTFYDDEISNNAEIDVIYNIFQGENTSGHMARLDMINNYNYHFDCGSYPVCLEKKYDLIVLNMEYSSFDAFDKTASIRLDNVLGGVFSGNELFSIIIDTMDYLTDDGTVVIKIPFTFISKLDIDLINKNIIDKIVYLKKEREYFLEFGVETKNVYMFLKKNKFNDEIELIDEVSGERCSVKNELVIKNNGCANMHIYTKHNPMLEKLYRIKEDNEKQLQIINKESKLIDKQIDELDFEDK